MAIGVWLLWWVDQGQVCGFGSVWYGQWVVVVEGFMATDMLWGGDSRCMAVIMDGVNEASEGET